MLKEKKYTVEKFLIQNMTWIILFFVILVFLLDFIPFLLSFTNITSKNFLESYQTLSIIGAMFVFWYGYKKYERDKEIDLIEKFTEKYNIRKEKIYSSEIKDYNLLMIEFAKLLDLIYIEFYFKYKLYICDELWKEWEYWIITDIEGSILLSLHYSIQTSDGNYTGNALIDSFILNYKLYHQNNSDTPVKLANKTFYIFIRDIILRFLEKNIIESEDFKTLVKSRI